MTHRSHSRRSRTNRKKHIHDIPLTPLIDTALTLLIIFMVTAPMIQNAIKIELPKGATQERVQEEKKIEIYIDKDERVFLHEQEYSYDAAIEALRLLIGSHEQTVVVKADQAIPYGRVVALVDRIKMVDGIKYVALATQPS